VTPALPAGDLHLHSTASDGTNRPSEVIRLASEQKLAAVALTDHDTLGGIEEARHAVRQLAAAGKHSPVFIPGVELSVHFDGQEIHLLAYFQERNPEHILSFLQAQRRARDRRNREMLAKLDQLGYYIRSDEIGAGVDSKRSWGRLHIARALVSKGYFKTVADAFSELLSPGRRAYVDRQRALLEDALINIKADGGIAVVAHPQKYRWCPPAESNIVPAILLEKCRKLKAAGVDGIEAGHGDAKPEEVNQMLAAALTFQLQYTAGSDDHGDFTPHRSMFHSDWNPFPEETATVVCALIRDKDGRCLLGRRAPTERLAGFYELPGGKVKPAEHNEQALVREIEEELGVQADVRGLHSVLWSAEGETFLALAVYDTVLRSAALRPVVHDDLQYMAAREAAAIPLLPADRAFFRMLAAAEQKNA